MREAKLSDNFCQFSVKNLTLESLLILALDTSFVCSSVTLLYSCNHLLVRSLNTRIYWTCKGLGVQK